MTRNRSVYVLILLLLAICATTACGKKTPPRVGLPTPTPPIRHRDALPLLLSLEDLGAGYTLAEMKRLEKGKGWNEETTRLSGYRHVYAGNGTQYRQVISQVECYLNAQDAQTAYRAFKETQTIELNDSGLYGPVNEGTADGLGKWATVFRMREQTDENQMRLDYVFIRENVLVHVAFLAPYSSDMEDKSLKTAQIVDQRVEAR